MKPTPETLLGLEAYSRQRAQLRAAVIPHRKLRSLQLGDHMTLQFEDETTIRYQIQEMLRIEKIFEADAIQQEIDAYAPLIPDGGNWKVTLLIEFPDPAQRQHSLALLKGVESRCWVEARGHAPVYAIADEDMERENGEKTSAVHFLRFEFAPQMIAALRGGAALAAGVDHEHYRHWVDPVPEPVKAALLADLD